MLVKQQPGRDGIGSCIAKVIIDGLTDLLPTANPMPRAQGIQGQRVWELQADFKCAADNYGHREVT